MAGYIMTIGSDEYLHLYYALNKNGKPRKRPKNIASSEKEGKELAKQYALEICIKTGTYSARNSDKGAPFIGTLADYLGMKAGDDIFFFKERNIYGIGKLVNIGDIDCRFRVHPKTKDAGIDDLVDEEEPEMHHFLCTFEPAPYFFKNGVDMDEILLFSPDKIKALRFFSGKSFIKLDDFESDAIKNVIARKNELYLTDMAEDEHYSFDKETHEKIAEKLRSNVEEYMLSVFDYINVNFLYKLH